jgi:CPA2 family monovalent cation:H+ antiporter-2
MLGVVLDITIILVLAVGAALVAHRFEFPSSIGLLVAGVLAGPDALGLIRNAEEIELLAEIGVVLLLFVIGLEFSLADLRHLRRQFLVGGSLQFLGTAAVIGAATLLRGFSLSQSVYLGFVVALSSTAIVLKMLQDRAELDAPHGRTALSMLIYQDIAVVPVMLMAPLFVGELGGSAATAVLGLAGRVAAVGAFAYVAYRWAVPWLLRRITATRSSEAFLLGVFAMVLGIALFTQSLGLSLALGAFIAGLLISESPYSNQAVAAILPFRDVFMSLFFISIGLLLDVGYLLDNPLRLALLTLGILTIKPLLGAIAALVVGVPLRSAILTGLAIAQIGEFSLVAISAGVDVGLFGEAVFQTVLDTAVLSMLLTPVIFAAAPRWADALSRTPLARLERTGFASARVDAAHSYSDHVLIAGYGWVGSNLARAARLTGVPYTIVEFDAATVREATQAGEPIHFGDATQETVLRHIDADKARAIVVTIDDPPGARRVVDLARRIAPDAFILVRSRYLREVEPLKRLGADEVIADELEASIEVFARVLSRMMVPREDIKQLIGNVRGEWGRMERTFSKEATSLCDLRLDVADMVTHMLRVTGSSPLLGSSLADSGLKQEHEATVILIGRGDESIANPSGDTVIHQDDLLLLVGPRDWDPDTVR